MPNSFALPGWCMHVTAALVHACGCCAGAGMPPGLQRSISLWYATQELVNKLCASPAMAGATLLAAFEQPGTPEANNAVAASIQSCPGSDDDWLGRLYMRTANPNGDHSDGSQTVRWAAAATRDVGGEIE